MLGNETTNERKDIYLKVQGYKVHKDHKISLTHNININT